ncbi:NEDD8 ultimate buster 1-like isoform X2 [Carcharodon carcharias]|uniref:NEDD8 ultimate buster 1-like isoform X2 n=1 Tax=Carcharodon carcharias TaxID=13397 RepID=UPI001B7DABB9|nr:NEDD8 ultimate buster 1-like isoform X2 [Carcharodon carcharias]
MATDGPPENVVQDQVRSLLESEKVKLWEPPYTAENKSASPELKILGEKYALQLCIDLGMVENVLESLRCNSLQGLSAKKTFEDTGLATIRINYTSHAKRKEKTKLTTKLNISAKDLRTEIAKLTGMNEEHVKLIMNSKVLKMDRSLAEQNIKNNSIIMVMQITLTEEEAKEQETVFQEEMREQDERKAKISRTRKGAEILAQHGENTDLSNVPYLEIADQKGRPIPIPAVEKKALLLAMTLHEKGRAFMKKKDYASALLYLLDADEEFGKCGSELLNIVDNHAVLQLEVVWCYLQLEQLDCLRDAEERLKRAQTRLNNCYGENLERLYNLKGNTANEQVLYLRLKLLQGVVLYHKGKLDQTKNHLNEAEMLLGKLSVDDKKVVQLMSLGFTAQEARLGLRACNNDIDFAASHIYQRREEKAEIRRKEKAERKRKKQEAVNSLMALGYSEKAAAKAFRSANNNLDRAIELLKRSPEPAYLDEEEAGPSNRVEISEETINQVAFLGFDHSAAEIALRRFNGNIERAVQALIDHGGYLPSSLLNSPPSSSSPEDMEVGESSEEKQREREIVEEVLADIPEHEEDYLDMPLEEEREVIIKYKTWLRGSQNLPRN